MENGKFQFFKGVRNCFNMIYLHDKRYLFISMFMAIFQGIVPSISLLVSQNIINNMQTFSKSVKEILVLLIMYLIINIIPSIFQSFYGYYRIKFNKNFEKHIETMMLEKSLTLSLKDFEDDNTYDMINRAQSQKGFNITILSENLISIIRESVSTLSLIVVLSQFQLWLIIVVIVIPVLKSLYSIKLGKEQYDVSVNRTWKERKAWYIDYLLSKGYAYKEIMVFRIGSKLINHYKKLKEDIISQDMNIAKKNFIATLLCTVLDSIVSAGIIEFIIIQGILKKILIGDATTYIQAVQSIKDNVESIFSLFSSVIQDLFYTDLLFKFLDYNCKEDSIEHIKIFEKIGDINKIELINISYKYNHSSEYSLKNINLTLNKNDPIAILGKNGSGKTTLLKILLGFYDDYEGDILINGKNLKDIEKDEYIRKVSCMFQDYIKYEATLKENVAMGDVYKSNLEEKVKSKLKETKLKPSIYEEDGLETILGTWFGKKQLSMGEWQKVAISRTLMKDADMYIFDEPDSSLDSEAGNELLSLYKKTFENKIGIFITHHIQHAKKITNNIVVLENGKLLESGRHDELMDKKGVYFNLFCNCK
ncbi:TPA: ABC transporter ATP-binding protein [Clostridioides difficile]|nr:ABC transporter ATP-binding protein [Clostridioides difficile]